MSTYEIILKLCKQRGIAGTALEKELGFGRGSIGKLKNGKTTAERLQKIADYFGVTVDYLMTGEEPEQKEITLTAKDERDIEKDLNRIMDKLMNDEEGPATYGGDPINPEAAELFREELQIALRRLKIINKEKYTPKKYKK